MGLFACQAGLLETLQGDSTHVTALDSDPLLDPLGFFAELQSSTNSAQFLAARRVLEGESVSLAVARLTDDDLAELDGIRGHVDEITRPRPRAFHRRRFGVPPTDHQGERQLPALIDTLVSGTFRTRLRRAVADVEPMRESHGEHRAILDELRKPSQAGHASGCRPICSARKGTAKPTRRRVRRHHAHSAVDLRISRRSDRSQV